MTGQDLLAYLGIIRKRVWVIALLMAVTVGTMLAVFIAAKPVYSARVRFMVQPSPSGDVSLYQGFRATTRREEIAWTRANFIEVLRSSMIAWETVESEGVDMRGSELLKRMEIVETEGSDFVQLTVAAETAEEAQMLANGLVENAVRYYSDLQAQPATDSLNFITAQLETAQRESEAAEQRLMQFQIENHMGDLDSEIMSLQALIRSLRLERDQAEAVGDESKASAYDRLIAGREVEMQGLLQLSAEYATLRGAVQRSQSLYNLLLDKEAEARLTENEVRTSGFVQIVEPARKPSHPDSPFNVKLIVAGAVASLIVGVLLTFVLEYVGRLRDFVPTEEVPVEFSS